MTAPEVIVRRDGLAGHLSLNRPKAVHALTREMCRTMSAALTEWRDDPEVRVVLIDHYLAPDIDPKLSRGFCSGGDINLVRNSALTDNGAAGRAFFFDEYRLNHQLFTYPKPVVTFMDGITMGGGVGISLPALYRVATENTRFAMPESAIGLFPDVGGGWYLSRLPGRIGQYLALTGARIDGADCIWAGLATHFVRAVDLMAAKAQLAVRGEPEGSLAVVASESPHSRLAKHAADIEHHFASNRLEDILASLAADESEWAQQTLAMLRSKSPQTCKVALRQLSASRKLDDFADNMAMEYRIASRVLLLPDFAEGVRAVIVEKDNNPKWNPATPEGVTEQRLDAIFAPLPAGEEWTPL